MAEFRERTSLAGTWAFRTDPGDEGRAEEWHAPGADWPDAAAMAVPSAWQEHEQFREYEGVAWYRRTVPADPSGRAFLRFGAVDYHATVFVDGQRVGEHRGGYLPFEVEVTDALGGGESTVVVRVEDHTDPESPHGKQGGRWYTPVGGIWQPVELVERPAAYVAGIEVTPDLAGEAAEVAVTVAGSDPGAHDAAVTVSRAGETVGRADPAVGLDGRAGVRIGVPDPDPWSPAEPALYDVSVDLRRDGEAVDRDADTFGMRSVAVEEGQLLLNGDPLFVRGALDQGYYPGTLYRPFEDGLFEDEIRRAKEMGFNLLRKHVKPAHPDFLDAADRLGILVWEEPASPDVDTDRSRRELREQLRGVIERDYNHPSVVAYSAYNEEWGLGGADDERSLWESAERQAYLAELVERAREWDPTRLVCDNSGWAHVETDIDDYHEYVVSPERASVWADRLAEITSNPAANYARPPERPGAAATLVSEFGTWGVPDLGALREREGRPAWAARAVEGRGEFADAAGVDGRFLDRLADTFDGYGELASTWQARAAASNRAAVERMRARDGVQGYVLTEFSDIEWELNGVLDYHREPKDQAGFVDANQPLMVAAVPDCHAVWSDGRLRCDVVVSNHTADAVDAPVEWTAFGQSGAVGVTLDGHGTVRVEDAVAVTPDTTGGTADGVARGSVELSLSCGAGTATAAEPVVAVERGAGREPVAVYAPAYGDALAGAHEVVATPAAADAAVVTTTEGVRSATEAGLHAVLVPGRDGRFDDAAPFAVRELSAGASWHLAAGLLYHDDPLLSPLSAGKTPGWAFAGLGPYDLLEVEDGDRVRVGYVEGWLANHAAALAARRLGAGTVTACAFRVGPAYGDHPAATYLLDGLLAGR